MCKSGITTKWTCGIITAKNQTVTYSGGRTVYGMTRHNACVEPGDSGGANVSVLGGYHAEGVTSGASMIEDATGKKHCRAKFGLRQHLLVLPDRRQPGLLRPEVRRHHLVVIA